MWAAVNGNLEVVNVLVQAGADLNLQDQVSDIQLASVIILLHMNVDSITMLIIMLVLVHDYLYRSDALPSPMQVERVTWRW